MYDIGIIGGGPAGYVAAERAGQKGLNTILIKVSEIFRENTFAFKE